MKRPNWIVSVLAAPFTLLLVLSMVLPPDAGGQAQAPAAAPAAPGDPRRGKDLFRGVIPLQNGGPACLSCHGGSGVAVLGGGTLGPDLSTAFPKYGPGLPDVLTQIPFPTMRPLYAGRELAAGEVADLTAFLSEIAPAGPERTTPRVLVIWIIAVVAVLVFVLLVWQNRLLGVRRALTREAGRPEARRSEAGRSEAGRSEAGRSEARRERPQEKGRLQ